MKDSDNVPDSPKDTPEDIIDGIVALEEESSDPKPLSFLKSQIISENAEVLFDPILPLPSTSKLSKLRPKLRPVPRLAPLRRSSIQGSTSALEDEGRRALLSGGGASTPVSSRQRHDSQTSLSALHSLPFGNAKRTRHDSVCSTVTSASQATAAAQPTASSSLSKGNGSSKYIDRHLDIARRRAAMRRRRETAKQEALTMYDLIFYNPSSNPILPDQDELKAQRANEKAEAVRKAEHKAKKAELPKSPKTKTDAAPVPQIKLGPNGEIMVDEQSLVIPQTDKRKISPDVVHESAWNTGPGKGYYRRTPRTAEWSDAETVRFYRAVAVLGTDFMLMEGLFPERTRRDLKLKYKKEERVNMAQVEMALRSNKKWDPMQLLKEFEEEREEEKKRAREKAEELRRIKDQRQCTPSGRPVRARTSRGSKALDITILPRNHKRLVGLTADDIIQQHNEAKAKMRAKRQQAKSTVSKCPPHPQASSETNQDFVIFAQIPDTSSSQDRSDNSETSNILKLDLTISQDESPEHNQPPVPLSKMPSNVESGSLVVLTVDNPKCPSKKMLQTYLAGDGGELTPVLLDESLLNSVVTYIKQGKPNNIPTGSSSPHLNSPSSAVSQDIEMKTSPKRAQHSS